MKEKNSTYSARASNNRTPKTPWYDQKAAVPKHLGF